MEVHYTQKTFYRASILVIGVGALLYSFLYNPPKDQFDNVYSSQSFDHKKFSNILLKEVSRDLGIDYRNEEYVTGKKMQDIDPGIEINSPAISVLDFNQDSYMDLYITTGDGRPNLLYINQQGKGFKEEAEKYGIADLNQNGLSVFSFWGDFNNDGLTDFLQAKYGCHKFFLGTKSGKFEDHSEWLSGYCSRPNGVNAADFYQDGKLSLIFANFMASDEESASNVLWLNNTRYDNTTGGKNVLFKNDGKKFTLEKKADFLTRSYSHSAGITDINLDGYPDIFFSNDYAHDEMFLNQQDGSFKDVTNYYIPKIVHGLSGMNTEFFDYDADGLIDLYVTNIHKPPFNRYFNLLWKKKPDNTFENFSNSVGVAECGFSWAAKFVDVDNDGEADLPVVNGRARSSIVGKPSEGKSMWYERIEVSQIPRFIRGFYTSKEGMKGKYISAFERNCFFAQRDGQFYDIAEQSGFDDKEENRAMALIDYDNDGRVDIVTAGGMARLKIYHNETTIQSSNSWIGFSLKDKNGNPIPHGARIKFKLSNGKIILRELYPANGYKGFSEPRFHVGLGQAKIAGNIEVFWPMSKKTQTVTEYKINQYNLISESINE